MLKKSIFTVLILALFFLICVVGSFGQSPTVVSLTPTQNQLNVPTSMNLSVTFDINMDASSINDSTFVVNARSTGLHSGFISYNGLSKNCNVQSRLRL